jgi:hypothetical protein
MEENNFETRQERRERRLKKKREHMLKHGAGVVKIYRNAAEKRLKNSTRAEVPEKRRETKSER